MSVTVRPQGAVGRIADYCMMPIMYALQGNLRERPQRTHFWNNHKFRYGLPAGINTDTAVAPYILGDSRASEAYVCGFIPRFHMPLWGGWNQYVVLETEHWEEWFIGWYSVQGFAGYSRVPIAELGVRMTVGPHATSFFALSRRGEQLPLRAGARGEIGSAPPEHARLMLL